MHFFLYKIGRAVANGGGVGGVTRTKNNIPQNVKLYSLHSRAILAYNKEKWDKFSQFCEKLCYFVISEKFVLSRKILVCLKNFWTPKMVH